MAKRRNGMGVILECVVDHGIAPVGSQGHRRKDDRKGRQRATSTQRVVEGHPFTANPRYNWLISLQKNPW